MYVIKRNGQKASVDFGKIQIRLTKLKNEYGVLNHVNVPLLTKQIITNMKDYMLTSEIDDLSANLSADFALTTHLEYNKLASRIVISNNHKNTLKGFLDKTRSLYYYKKGEKYYPKVTRDYAKFVEKHHKEIENIIDYSRDYKFDYFGYRTLEKSYLLKLDGKIIERPQDLFMRVAIAINLKVGNMEEIKETYLAMTDLLYTHATPTLFNAGTPIGQLASCFLLHVNDSLVGLCDTQKEGAIISKNCGGVGLSFSRIRSRGSLIESTNGESDGIVPFLKWYNALFNAFNQGGRRKGSCAIYLQLDHPDFLEFIELRKNMGAESQRARDLFYGCWVPDLFMKRVQENGTWTFFDPNVFKGLNDVYGEEYESLYTTYEKLIEIDTKSAKYATKKRALDVFNSIIQSQLETGMPYMMYKDRCNMRSNQKNLGTIQCSNLCSEIVEYTSDKEIAVCNLASICLPKFVEDVDGVDNKFPTKPKFNFQKLANIARIAVRNLNRTIDVMKYPVEKTRYSNFKNRPLGLGVQGLADTFFKMKYPFDSHEAKVLNKQIFETIHYAALTESAMLAKKEYFRIKKEYKANHPNANKKQINENVPKTSGAYPSYLDNGGCPLSKGIFQWEMANLTKQDLSGLWEWDNLREMISVFGVRNSLITAIMPTASTSQIMGNSMSIEPYLSNIYNRSTLAGEFVVMNKYLVNDLHKLGLWNKKLKDIILINNGSIQYIEGLPKEIKNLYKTVWETKQKVIIEMAADRGAFIDQSQSMNLFFESPDLQVMQSAHMYGWKMGLKTGMYYLRQRAKIRPQMFDIDPKLQKEIEQKIAEQQKNLTPIKEKYEVNECLACSG